MTDLTQKAINIKGKSYVLVSDRILSFNEKYPQGSIVTQLVSTPDAEMVVIKAKVTPDCGDPNRFFTGYSQATWGDGMVNKTAALENCETSAVGRALGMMGIGVLDSIASVDEINKAQSQPAYAPKTGFATDKQINAINKLIKSGKLGDSIGTEIPTMTKQRASELIGKALAEPEVKYDEGEADPADIPF